MNTELDLQEARARIGELEKELHEFSAFGARIVLGTYKDLLSKAQARIQELEKPVDDGDLAKIDMWVNNWTTDWNGADLPDDHDSRTSIVAGDLRFMRSVARRLSLQVKEGRAFKDYVHLRLDQAGIPTHPDGEHSKAGCRVGDRLDIALLPKG